MTAMRTLLNGRMTNPAKTSRGTPTRNAAEKMSVFVSIKRGQSSRRMDCRQWLFVFDLVFVSESCAQPDEPRLFFHPGAEPG